MATTTQKTTRTIYIKDRIADEDRRMDPSPPVVIEIIGEGTPNIDAGRIAREITVLVEQIIGPATVEISFQEATVTTTTSRVLSANARRSARLRRDDGGTLAEQIAALA